MGKDTPNFIKAALNDPEVERCKRYLEKKGYTTQEQGDYPLDEAIASTVLGLETEVKRLEQLAVDVLNSAIRGSYGTDAVNEADKIRDRLDRGCDSEKPLALYGTQWVQKDGENV